MPCSPLKFNDLLEDVLPPSSVSENKPRKQEASSKQTCLLIVGCLAYNSILKMEALHFSERSENFYRTTRRLISEDGTLPSMLQYFEA
jgi:hypothetical protein